MSMRPQYHFRTSPDGLQAWDMVKIVTRLGHLPHEEVALSDIAELDEDWWFSDGKTPTPRAIAQHMKQVQAADRTYPIIVDPDGRLMDGMHRVVQALLAGDVTVKAIRLPHLPPPDYIGVAPEDLPYD